MKCGGTIETFSSSMFPDCYWGGGSPGVLGAARPLGLGAPTPNGVEGLKLGNAGVPGGGPAGVAGMDSPGLPKRPAGVAGMVLCPPTPAGVDGIAPALVELTLRAAGVPGAPRKPSGVAGMPAGVAGAPKGVDGTPRGVAGAPGADGSGVLYPVWAPGVDKPLGVAAEASAV